MTEFGFAYTNATLTAVNAAGSGDGSDADPALGAPRWTGTIGIIVDDSRQTLNTPGRTDEIEQTRLEIPWRVGSLVKRGDTLTFTYAGQTQQRVADNLLGEQMMNRRRIILRPG
jgi:hypothetical protein